MILANRLILLINILILTCSNLSGHNPNEAFFIITTTDTHTEVLAELPWSVRNDLIATYPSLQDATDDQDYQDHFEMYLRDKLVLQNSSGSSLHLMSVTEQQHNGHSHQHNFKIIYQDNDLHIIKNTILFGTYPKQKYYHNI